MRAAPRSRRYAIALRTVRSYGERAHDRRRVPVTLTAHARAVVSGRVLVVGAAPRRYVARLLHAERDHEAKASPPSPPHSTIAFHRSVAVT
ncbi:MAG: hypothetical protein OHK0013_24630 [Sandaracinaceae bacterium]